MLLSRIQENQRRISTMLIVYESRTGFTKRYADMLAEKTGLKAYRTNELPETAKGEEIIFLGWMRAGIIQGLDMLRTYNVIAVCASGIGHAPEPSAEEVISMNKIQGMPFFYLRGGCLPLKEQKGLYRIMLSFFVKMLKSGKVKTENPEESASIIENGFDGVREENLEPLLQWLKAR